MHYLRLDNIFRITATLHEAVTQAHTLSFLPRPSTLQSEAEHT